MLLPGTQMHMLTFSFICLEIILIIHLIAYKLARPINKTLTLDIFLLAVLILYNTCGGLLPDPNIPGGYIMQQSIAYGTGFLAPVFFPYYVWRGFGLEQMTFHARKGVFYFLVFPYVAFTIILISTQDLTTAEYVLIIPMIYGIWVLIEIIQNVYGKYHNSFSSKAAGEELIILILCLTPWVCLPIITYSNLPQHLEVAFTNSGFLMLLALHVKRTIIQIRKDYQKFTVTEKKIDITEESQPIKLLEKEKQMLTTEQRIQINTNKYPLTKREKEIVLLLCKGHTYQHIAQELFISPRTVGKHVENIFDKLGVANRHELTHNLSE